MILMIVSTGGIKHKNKRNVGAAMPKMLKIGVEMALYRQGKFKRNTQVIPSYIYKYEKHFPKM